MKSVRVGQYIRRRQVRLLKRGEKISLPSKTELIQPEPVHWLGNTSFSIPHGAWKSDPLPFIRVGEDISHKKYREEHGKHD